MSYTKGPWLIVGNEHAYTIVSEKYVIADVFPPDEGCISPETEEEAEANANLIATAPELVEVLERLTKEVEGLLGYAESTLRQVVGHTNVAVMKHHLQAATETLTKAKGGQP